MKVLLVNGSAHERGCTYTALNEVAKALEARGETVALTRITDKTVALINDFKDYFTRHNQVIYENPSPGNKAGKDYFPDHDLCPGKIRRQDRSGTFREPRYHQHSVV